MSPKSSLQKFERHLKEGGLGYAFWRGLKFFVFFIKKPFIKQDVVCQNTLVKGKLQLDFNLGVLRIFWDGVEVTKDPGINFAVNSSGAWVDSSKAQWQILETGSDYFKAKVIFKELYLTQILSVKIEEESKINLEANIYTDEWLRVDEFRILCVINPRYKTWINEYHQENFPRQNNSWSDLCKNSGPISLVGVRFPTEGKFVPSISLETKDKSLFPLIQNPPSDMLAHIIGFRKINTPETKNYSPGEHHLFRGVINLFEDDASLDIKIEQLRKNSLGLAAANKIRTKEEKDKLKVLLVNLPWCKEGRWGVRAGSRWPHIKDTAEDNYLAFPFFLAYAASLLQKYEISATLIDAIAEQIPEDKFIELTSRKDCDILIAETSTPSFYNDLAILRKISSLGIPIVLCGPHTEIYQPEFLKENPFISFILYGEYEFTLLELIKCLQENGDLALIKGLLWRKGNEVIKNPARAPCNINLLPWPQREGLPMSKYNDLPGNIPAPSAQILASRGCPFGCTFCLWPQVIYQGNHYRPRDIDDVINEMGYLVKEKGFKSVYFDDDTFNVGRERMLEFCRKIKEKKLQDIPWAIMARADLMDKELLAEMKSAGLWAVKYGVESCKDSFLSDCHKNLELDKITKIVRITNNLGIRTHLTFCFGFPGETAQTIQKTIDYALSLKPYSVQFSILTPFPGTRLFDQLDAQGKILTKDWSGYDGQHSCVFKPDNLSAQDLEEAKKKAYLLWAEQQRKRRGLGANVERFKAHIKEKGLRPALAKTLNYLSFVFFKKRAFMEDNKPKQISRTIRKSYLSDLKHKIKNEGGLVAFIKKLLNYIISGKLRHKYLRIMGIYNGEYAFIGPSHVQIDLTYDCNNNCLACWCNSPLLEEKAISPQKRKETLPLGLVKKLLDELSKMGTKEIYFSGGGEPFMHPNIMEILAYAKAKKFICYVNTNFTLLDKEKIKRIVDLGVDHLTVSTWSATAKTYAQTHPNKSEDDFCRIVDNLKYLNNIKKKTPHIKLYNVIFNLNYFEFQQMLEFAHNTRSESVEFALVDTIPGKTEKLLLDQGQVNELRGLTEAVAQKIDRNNCYKGVRILNFPSFLRRISSDSDLSKATYDRNIIDKMPCYIGWDFSRIMPNGDVNACLKAHRIPTGNLFQHSFKTIWNDAKQRDFRKKALSLEKKDKFFQLIGNDPNIQEAGCYKSCDDVERNLFIHNSLEDSLFARTTILKSIARTIKIKSEKKNKVRKIIIPKVVIIFCLFIFTLFYSSYFYVLRIVAKRRVM